MTATMAMSAAIEARMTARSGPSVFDTPNSTTAKVSEQAMTGGATSSAREKPDMTTTM